MPQAVSDLFMIIVCPTVLLSDRHLLSWIGDRRITGANATRKGSAPLVSDMFLNYQNLGGLPMGVVGTASLPHARPHDLDPDALNHHHPPR
jgi:hypothetical protein